MNLPTPKDVNIFCLNEQVKNLRYQRKCAIWCIAVMLAWVFYTHFLLNLAMKIETQRTEALRQLVQTLQVERALREGTPSDIAIDKH